MNKPFFLKVLGIFLLTVLMSWAVSYVNSLIIERQSRQESVKQNIAQSSAGTQTIIGPVLAVPYTEEYIEYNEEFNAAGIKVLKPISKRASSIAYVLPENLELTGGFSNEYKKLGIYKALMYQLGGKVKGNFNLPANLNINPAHEYGRITFQPAYIALGISDTRGITGQPNFTWNKQALKFEQGSSIESLGNGIHATIGIITTEVAQNIPFEFNLNLRGMENFNFSPIAENNKISLQSSWRHPHFSGSFLPNAATQKITPAGFEAHWEISSLSSSNQATLNNTLTKRWDADANKSMVDAGNHLESLSVSFVEPINVYSQADRATKYGLLFIGLTFAGFFIFEILKRLRIHPAQYTLVGLSMALFYLLLVSFSEHIGFAWSYLAASTSCVILLGYYLSHVLKSKMHGFVFSTMLITLYGALYGILASEDNALLMGTLLVFGLLALTMVVTRKVDWYQIGSPDSN
ncbi:cell envelope integrity protein CreD [Methylotenera mobilis]|uniref:cell envelope integrity protein CreD n=1 Tax=Methylotenera mobilis TaxID=359408 RepID=UPI0003715425|nr:cell envelope integrity protein CreD [Methylotenera mobilis]PPC97089.1 MAG: cell envelope integrity protein CreD [Methylotenera sp.]